MNLDEEIRKIVTSEKQFYEVRYLCNRCVLEEIEKIQKMLGYDKTKESEEN